MAPARLSRSVRRLLAFVVACLFAFANVALAAKACPGATGGCLTSAVAGISSAPEHHDESPCTMAATKVESTNAVTAFAKVVEAFAVPAVPALVVASPVAATNHAVAPLDVPLRDVLDVFGRLRL